MVINTPLETAIQCLGNSAYLQNLELRLSSWGVDKLNWWGAGGENVHFPGLQTACSQFKLQ